MWPFLRGFHERPNLQPGWVLDVVVRCTVYVPFFLLPNQPDVRLRLTVAFRLARMFRPVKDQNLPRCAFGGNQIGVLRHIPRLVDFSGVNNLLDDLNLGRRGDSVTTHFPPFLVPFKVDIAFREVDCCDLKIILGLVGGVSTKQKPMDRVWFVCRTR